MRELEDEISAFQAAAKAERANAAQLAALQCLCGLDLAAVLQADAKTRALAIGRVDRLLERERMKGLAGHWSYDLNRHIALKQAFDRLRGVDGVLEGRPKNSSAKAKRRPRAPSSGGGELTADASSQP